jgi:hypothetical protein
MAKKEKEAGIMTGEEVIQVVPKQGDFDITKRVKQIATDKHPFRSEGEEINVSKAAADKNLANGWAK